MFSALPFQLLTFLGSFLLFQSELIFGRLLLPSFGSAASVWTTCLMFYQGGLLLGYLYGQRASRWIAEGRYRYAHLLVLVLPMVFFPFRVVQVDAHPVLSIVVALGCSLGVPFVALSTTSVVVQRWFTRSSHPRRQDPYFLYGVGNLGALLALLSYPFVVEPLLNLSTQLSMWYGTYTLFVLLHLVALKQVSAESEQATAPEHALGQAREGQGLKFERGQGVRFEGGMGTQLKVGEGAGLVISAAPAHAAEKNSAETEGAGALEGTREAALASSWQQVLPPGSTKDPRDRPLFGGEGWTHDPSAPLEAPRPEGSTLRRSSQSLAWVLLPAGANSLLMATTNAVTVDAPMPLLWVLPLTIFLVTLIITFAKNPPSEAKVIRWALMSVMGALGALVVLATTSYGQVAFLVLHSLLLFVGCLLCHHNVVQSKPQDITQLGRYYTAQALGGWLGSLVVGLLMPLLFSWLASNLVDFLAAGGLILAGYVAKDVAHWKQLLSAPGWRRTVLVGSLLFGGLSIAGILYAGAHSDVHSSRTFYGLYRVKDTEQFRLFMHGNTIHGLQLRAPGQEREPLAYYHDQSPLAVLLGAGIPVQRVAVVGLGVGTLASFARPGDVWDYYELDPEVETIAREHYPFLGGSQGAVKVILGDARLTLAQAEPQTYDLIIMDTFSSDFMPTHLLTEEALRTYLDKLKGNGILVFNITNRLFDLRPVLYRLGEQLELFQLWGGRKMSGDPMQTGRFSSRWYAFMRSSDMYMHVQQQRPWRPVEVPREVSVRRPWTDDYVNLLHAIPTGDAALD